MRSNRSEDAKQYRKLYMTKQWKHLRRQILARDLYRCQQNGCGINLVAGRSNHNSAVVHHRQPHKGNMDLFYDPQNLEAVCWSCHSGAIQREEALGYSSAVGLDGWPTDPKHPSNHWRGGGSRTKNGT